MHRYHNIANRLVEIGLYLWNSVVGNIQPELEENVAEVVKIIYKFKTMIIHGGNVLMLIAVLFQCIGAVFTTGNNVDIGAGQQMLYDGMEIVF